MTMMRCPPPQETVDGDGDEDEDEMRDEDAISVMHEAQQTVGFSSPEKF